MKSVSYAILSAVCLIACNDSPTNVQQEYQPVQDRPVSSAYETITSSSTIPATIFPSSSSVKLEEPPESSSDQAVPSCNSYSMRNCKEDASKKCCLDHGNIICNTRKKLACIEDYCGCEYENLE